MRLLRPVFAAILSFAALGTVQAQPVPAMKAANAYDPLKTFAPLTLPQPAGADQGQD